MMKDFAKKIETKYKYGLLYLEYCYLNLENISCFKLLKQKRKVLKEELGQHKDNNPDSKSIRFPLTRITNTQKKEF